MNNKYIFPKDFFALDPEEKINQSNKKIQKEEQKLLNPSYTIKINSSRINELNDKKKEINKDSLDQSNIPILKRNNLKIIIQDNSNDELEPSTSGSKISQYTPSNSPLIYLEKNNKKEENNFILLNKNDKNIISDEELFKVTPHFINDNKVSIESAKKDIYLHRPISPNELNPKKAITPLTCDSKITNKSKFNFNYEIKEKGVILPKDKNNAKKIKKVGNSFRKGNKKGLLKHKDLNSDQKVCSNNSIFSGKRSQCNKLNYSPKNSSFVSFKNNIIQTSPIQLTKKQYNSRINEYPNKKKLIKEKSYNNIDNCKNKIKYAILEDQHKLKSSRPNSAKNIYNKNKDFNQKFNINRNNNNKELKKKMKNIYNSINLPLLPEKNNKLTYMKTQLETEINTLFSILPENYEDYPEIANNFKLIFQDIFGLKEYLHKNTQRNFRSSKDEKNKK
jgi:hypothetical protein